MNTISLRPATSADWDAIAALLRAGELPTAGAQQHLPAFFVAEREDELVGVAGLEIYGEVALMRSVSIAAGLRGQRLGGRLVEALVDQARQRGVAQVFLLTTTAQNYFPRFGFREVERATAPAALLASVEFKGVCPASAVFMTLQLDRQ